MRTLLPQPRFTVKSTDLRPSNRLALSLYLKEVDVPTLISTGNTCTEEVSILETIVKTSQDIILHVRSKTIHSNETPWINAALKDLIRRRQRALTQGNLHLYSAFKLTASIESGSSAEREYYEAKIGQLIECKPSVWWKEVKKLSSMSSTYSGHDDCVKSLQHIDDASNKHNLPISTTKPSSY